MNNLTEQLEQLDRAVPEAPEFVGSVMGRLPQLALISADAHRRRLTRMRFAIGAIAASILVAMVAALMVMVLTPSPPEAFGEVVQRVSRFDSERHWVRSETPAEPKTGVGDYQSTFASGGRRRSTFGDSTRPSEIMINNAKESPEVQLMLYPDEKSAVITLADRDREALYGDNPVGDIQDMAAKDVMTAPDEMYKSKRVHVYVGKPGAKKSVHRVLVDKDSGMPLRIEMRSEMPQGIFTWVLEDFEWNPPIDDSTFSTQPPVGYTVTYNLIKPLRHGLDSYAGHFDGCLPDRVDSKALDQLKQKSKEYPVPPSVSSAAWLIGLNADADWGFRVPAFAAAHHIDFRYYGAGQRMRINARDGKVIAAIETAPGSGVYDEYLSNCWLARVDRSKLP